MVATETINTWLGELEDVRRPTHERVRRLWCLRLAFAMAASEHRGIVAIVDALKPVLDAAEEAHGVGFVLEIERECGIDPGGIMNAYAEALVERQRDFETVPC